MKWDDNNTCTSDSVTYHRISAVLDNSNEYRDELRRVFQPGLDYHVSFVINVNDGMDGVTHVANTANIVAKIANINVINMALYLLYPNRIKYNIIFNNIPEAIFMTFNPNAWFDNLLYPPVFTALVKSYEKIYALLDLIRFINMPKLRTEDLFLRPDIPIRTTNRYLVLIDEVLGKGSNEALAVPHLSFIEGQEPGHLENLRRSLGQVRDLELTIKDLSEKVLMKLAEERSCENNGEKRILADARRK